MEQRESLDIKRYEGTICAAGDELEYGLWLPVHESSPSLLSAPWLLLHEGLGCVAIWKDFPAQLARKTSRPVYAYSRAGYGHSSRIILPRSPDFMEREAYEVLPEVVAKLALSSPLLLGHSDGGSIALLAASSGSTVLAGVVTLAAHVFNEPMCTETILKTGKLYREGPLRSALRNYHPEQVDNTFWGWHDVWLSEAFRHWNISDLLNGISVPTLALQGEEDTYGSVSQLRTIAARIPGAQSVLLPQCGHEIYRDQPLVLLETLANFIES